MSGLPRASEFEHGERKNVLALLAYHWSLAGARELAVHYAKRARALRRWRKVANLASFIRATRSIHVT
jgi:hypothetical protein